MSDGIPMLPQTATGLAKAMDLLEERLLALPVEMVTKDPWAVPASLLDFLAWENSVDMWDDGWPEDVKRNVIAVSAEVHRYKGPPHAVKTAMSVFGVEVELVEWWQEGGSGVPATYRVLAVAGSPTTGEAELEVNGPVVRAMRQVLASAAPVSRGWDLAIGVRVDAPARRAAWPSAIIRTVANTRIEPAPVVEIARGHTVVSIVRMIATIGS
ncbi:phage tail protein I [Tropicimonas sp. IMCC34043]|uniref:phage tail protein I n=1 Tax=Tropicimonas sp. IMCC34043 TaxID=2248760 RepID=UPI000E2626F8|nr:phage tail protein I [Tropicimonas sp. IMCC34043]